MIVNTFKKIFRRNSKLINSANIRVLSGAIKIIIISKGLVIVENLAKVCMYRVRHNNTIP